MRRKKNHKANSCVTGCTSVASRTLKYSTPPPQTPLPGDLYDITASLTLDNWATLALIAHTTSTTATPLHTTQKENNPMMQPVCACSLMTSAPPRALSCVSHWFRMSGKAPPEVAAVQGQTSRSVCLKEAGASCALQCDRVITGRARRKTTPTVPIAHLK